MPRILRSPVSKSFRLENVSVPNADKASCERWRITAASERMAVSEQKRRLGEAPKLPKTVVGYNLRYGFCGRTRMQERLPHPA